MSTECRTLRRTLRPLVWVILEEVALDAVVDDGRLMARTSARQLAEQLQVNPSTAAEALRVLGRHGVVSLEREKGPSGRFGLSVYQLRPPAGLSLVQPCTAEPPMVSLMVQPGMEELATAQPEMGTSHTEGSGLEAPLPDRSNRRAPCTVADSGNSGVAGGERSARRPGRRVASGAQMAPLSHCPGQESFDLGSVSS